MADRFSHRIQKFDAVGNFVLKWGSLGAGVGEFNDPIGVDANVAGSVLVAAFNNDRFQSFTSTGAFQWKVSTVADNGDQGLGTIPIGSTTELAEHGGAATRTTTAPRSEAGDDPAAPTVPPGALGAPELPETRIQPNPSSGVVAIEYALPAASPVTIMVYDTNGRRVVLRR